MVPTGGLDPGRFQTRERSMKYRVLEQRIPLRSPITTAERKAWLKNPRARFVPVEPNWIAGYLRTLVKRVARERKEARA